MLPSDSVETKTSWAVASVALAILGMSFGAAWNPLTTFELWCPLRDVAA